MPQVSYSEQRKIAEILKILFDDPEYMRFPHMINGNTVALTEEYLAKLKNCAKDSAILMAGLKCVPKTPPVSRLAKGSWLTQCLDGVHQAFKAYEYKFPTNYMCSVAGHNNYKSAIKTSTLYP